MIKKLLFIMLSCLLFLMVGIDAARSEDALAVDAVDEGLIVEIDSSTDTDKEVISAVSAVDEGWMVERDYAVDEEELDSKNDYWTVPIRKQEIGDMERNLKIDQAFMNAKKIVVVQEPEAQPVIESEPQLLILTNAQIIRSVLSPEAQAEWIDLNFNGAVLSDILMTIGDIAKINIVVDPALKSNVLDLHLNHVTIEEALLLVSDSYGLGFKKVGNSLYMTYREKIREENLASKVLKMQNVDVEQARMLLKDLVKSVTTSDQINSLIVVGSPEEIVRAEEIIQSIDQPQPQVILEAKIIEVNKDALRDLGIDWSDAVTVNYQEEGRPAELRNIEEAPGSAFEVFSIARNPLQFSSVIKMLEEQNQAKVLSNPRVTTLNNKEAEIFVGDRIPYTVTTVSGGVATTDVRFEEPGIRLKITPAIIEKDFVVIKVEPEVSYIYSFRGASDEYPWIKKRQATAYVRVKNNEPFVLGGLLNQEDKKNLFKVPMLGNLPLLGNLFSYEKRTVLDTELIITVTPTIVYGDR